MKTLSPTLLALLTTRQFYLVDLYQFTLFDGTVLRYAAGTSDIYADGDIVGVGDVLAVTDVVRLGNLYSNGGVEAGPYFERKGEHSRLTMRAGLQVDSLQFTVLPGTAQVLGVNFKRAVLIGLFDGATVILKRAVMSTYGDVGYGALTMFTGRVGQISEARGEGVRFTINSHIELLDQQVPRNLYQPGCVWTLYDSGCGLNQNNFAQTGSVASGSTQLIINCSLPQATGDFDQGKIKFTSGLNSGLWVGVRKYTQGSPGAIVLLQPLPNLPSVGDSFIVYKGCDKLQDTCNTKFNNLTRFRGFPYIPIPETAT